MSVESNQAITSVWFCSAFTMALRSAEQSNW